MASLYINTNTDGDTLVAAPGSRQFIRVRNLNITADDQVQITLKSNTTVIWGTYATDDTNSLGGIVLPPGQVIDCAPGEALKIGLSGAVSVRGSLEYLVLGQPDSPPHN